MDKGAIPLADLDGGIDLQTTLESGQTFLWQRDDGRAYGAKPPDRSPWYSTVLPTSRTQSNELEVLRVRQVDDRLEWQASMENGFDHLDRRLRLADDLDRIVNSIPSDPLLDRAFDRHRGLRLVEDPPFGCLISFICSAQMRVERIHRMMTRLARAYGDTVSFAGETYHAFPTPELLAAATEADLRSQSLGYRAPYVRDTAAMVEGDGPSPSDARELRYEAAREYLTQFVGVGPKVADCVLLFSLGFTEAVPLDTWIRTAIADQYPECDLGTYADTSTAIRERFGGSYAGYAQTYVFHFLRTGGNGDGV